jgi:queuine tRNA-ribosyltransferase
MWKTVKLMGKILPEDKPRYLMGVGTPDDIIKATQLGMDMFDCVLPTRLARHGSVFRRKYQVSSIKYQDLSKHSVLGKYELVNLLNSKYRKDGGVIDKNCQCPVCKGWNYESRIKNYGRPWAGAGFSCAYISHLLRSKEINGLRLATLHNLHQYLELMRELRA